MAKIVRAFALALLWIGCTAAGAAYSEEVDVFGTVDHFVWQEFSDNGTRVLKESGALLGLGVSYRKEFQEQIILDDSGEIFIGIVNYDGATQDGAPTTSTVDYLGLKLKADAGKKIGITEPVSIEPFAGLGLRAWLRNIRNGTTTAGRSVQGYTERWTTLHARLGARCDVDISPTEGLFAEAGVKLPLYNENTAYFSREGIGPDVTMHPGRQASFFAEAGMRRDRIKASVFYDGMRFSRSEDVAVSGILFHQPRSIADIYGLKLSYVF